MDKGSLLIVGNGFDLGCGLKTAYTDVYNEYVKSNSDNQVVKRFKEEIRSDYVGWSDFELGMAKYASRLSSEEELLECVGDFTQFMHRYLINVQAEFKKRIDSLPSPRVLADEFKSSLLGLGTGVSHRVDNMLVNRRANHIWNMSFISLNYTSTMDLLLRRFFGDAPSLTPVHIHGMLSDDPILGVDSESQLSVPYSITDKGRRSFIKPFFNSEFDPDRVDQAFREIQNADTIFLYGASMGDSDLSWRNKLVDWLNSDKNNQLFLYIHSYSIKTFRSAPERMNFEEDIKRDVLHHWGINDVDVYIDQFHIPCGVRLFNVRDALDKDGAAEKNA